MYSFYGLLNKQRNFFFLFIQESSQEFPLLHWSHDLGLSASETQSEPLLNMRSGPLHRIHIRQGGSSTEHVDCFIPPSHLTLDSDVLIIGM
jgi:hypothetical protein